MTPAQQFSFMLVTCIVSLFIAVLFIAAAVKILDIAKELTLIRKLLEKESTP